MNKVLDFSLWNHLHLTVVDLFKTRSELQLASHWNSSYSHRAVYRTSCYSRCKNCIHFYSVCFYSLDFWMGCLIGAQSFSIWNFLCLFASECSAPTLTTHFDCLGANDRFFFSDCVTIILKSLVIIIGKVNKLLCFALLHSCIVNKMYERTK